MVTISSISSISFDSSITSRLNFGVQLQYSKKLTVKLFRIMR